MKIYRVVIERPNRENTLDRVISELFESDTEAYKYIKGLKKCQEVHRLLEPEESVRLEIYDSEPVVAEYNITSED